MNNSINYSSFIDLFISSDDDYEPYGLITPAETHGHTDRHNELEPMQTALYDRAMHLSRDD